MAITFVTAFYLPSGSTYKSVDRYFSLFERLAGTGISIIIYFDIRLQSRGEALRKCYPNILECNYGVLDTDIPRNVILPAVRNYDKDTCDYMCIQLVKLRVMADVARRRGEDVLAWIDFGIYHMFHNHDRCDELLKLIATSGFLGDLILSPGYKSPYTNIFEHICWKHCGSLLIGSSQMFIRAYQRQTELVADHMPKLTWEVNYWAMMDEYFEMYTANHDDSILEQLVDIKKIL